MAKRDDTSKARPGRNATSATSDSGACDAGLDDVQALIETIEEQRSRLMQAESLLHCTLIAMESGDDEVSGPYYPDVIALARELVNTAVGQLDSVKLRPMIKRLKQVGNVIEDEALECGASGNMVKESAQVAYLYGRETPSASEKDPKCNPPPPRSRSGGGLKGSAA